MAARFPLPGRDLQTVEGLKASNQDVDLATLVFALKDSAIALGPLKALKLSDASARTLVLSLANGFALALRRGDLAHGTSACQVPAPALRAQVTAAGGLHPLR